MRYYKHPPVPFVGEWRGVTVPSAYVRNEGLGGLNFEQDLVRDGSVGKSAIILASAYYGYKKFGKKGLVFGLAGVFAPLITLFGVAGYEAYKHLKK